MAQSANKAGEGERGEEVMGVVTPDTASLECDECELWEKKGHTRRDFLNREKEGERIVFLQKKVTRVVFK